MQNVKRVCKIHITGEHMYYALEKNVYFVKGAKYSCVYNFDNSKLYHVNDKLGHVLESINEGKLQDNLDNIYLQEIVNRLLEEKILFVSNKPRTNSIEDLKTEDTPVDFAWIEITTKCNLKCIHCYNESDIQSNTEMSLDDFKEVIDALLKLGVRKIQIIGGEPFIVHRDLLKAMLEYAIGKFDFIEIFTNGTLVTSEWIDYFFENDIKIAISIYSYNSTVHDSVTMQRSSWEKTNNFVKKLYQKGVTYRVCNVIMKGVDVGKRKDVPYELSTRKDIVRMGGRADFSLLTDELIKKKLITKKNFEKPINKAFCQRVISGHNCFRNRIYVAANKEIFPCVMERRFSHGKICNNQAMKLDREILNLNKDKIEHCKICEYRYSCFDCRPDSLSRNIYEKPWYCTYIPELGEWSNVENFIHELRMSNSVCE